MREERIRYADRINEYIEDIRKCNDEGRFRDSDEKIEALPDILYGVAKHGGGKHCGEEELRNALWFVTSPFITSTRKIEFDIKYFMDIFMENTRNKEDLKAITKALVAIRTPDGVKHHLVKECSIRYINEILLPCLREICEYQVDCGLVIEWYTVALERELAWDQRAEIYNRLAYYHLWNHGRYNPGYGNHIDRAKGYFLAMERYGMPLKNPYSGFYGESNHEDIVREVLADTYKEHKLNYLSDYARLIIGRICESGMEGEMEYYEDAPDFWESRINDKDCDDLRSVMQGIYNAMLEGCAQDEIAKWENFLADYAELIEKLIDESVNMQNREETIRFMLHLLYDNDNWLIHCAERDAKKDSLRVWITRIKKIAGKYESLILDSLYNALIRELAKEGQRLDGKSEMTKVLEEKVFTVDCPAFMAKMGVENAFDYYNNVYYTDDCMALMKMYLDLGQMEKFELIMNKIEESGIGEANERLRKKYKLLLKLAGKYEHPVMPEGIMIDNFNMGLKSKIEEVEELYMTGRYEEALERCRGIKEMMSGETNGVKHELEKRERLLQYICFRLEESPSICEREIQSIRHISTTPYGTFASCISEDEWRKFHATFEEMAARYEENPGYEPEYYCISYCFEPKSEVSNYNEYLLNHKPEEKWCNWQR